MTLKVTFAVEIFVYIRRGGSRAWWCTGGVMRGDVNQQHRSITVTVQLISPRLVERKSVDNTNGIAYARCMIFVPSATMRVQYYAGSAIKRGSC